MRNCDDFDYVLVEQSEEQQEREASKLRTPNTGDARQNAKRTWAGDNTLQRSINRSKELAPEVSISSEYQSCVWRSSPLPPVGSGLSLG